MAKPLIDFNFEVIKKKEIDFSFMTETKMRKFPVHQHHLLEIEKTHLVYFYEPGAKYSQKEYALFLTKELKKLYKGCSVIFLGSKINEILLSE